MVRDWLELRRHPGIDPANAKSRSALIAEMAADLEAINKIPIAKMSTQVVISSVPMGTSALLLPAVQLFAAPIIRDPTEEEQQAAWSTAAFVREYNLVDPIEPKEDD
jgi:hypothetical protein